MSSECASGIREPLRTVLKHRYEGFGEAGCPAAIVTDDIRRDKNMLTGLMLEVFPLTTLGDAPTLLCQDPIHRCACTCLCCSDQAIPPSAFTAIETCYHPLCTLLQSLADTESDEAKTPSRLHRSHL